MAVELLDGPPSSGKKKYLKSLLSGALKEFSSEEVLLLSNSSSAAGEFKERARESIESYGELWIETVFSFAKKILRENYSAASLRPGFRIISDFEKRLIVRNILKNSGEINTVKGAGEGLVRDVADFLDIAKRNPGWKENIKNFSGASGLKYRDLALIEKKYAIILKKFNFLDFVDITLHTARLLEEQEDLIKFKKVLIYEGEDMDGVTARIAVVLIKNSLSSAVSINPDSSVYRFRGARPLHFKKSLEENFEIKVKNFSSLNKFASEFFLSAYSRDEEAKGIASHIAEKIKLGVNPSEICIITRSSGTGMEIFSEALRNKGINYVISGGIGFFRQREIIELLSLLRCLLEGDNAPELDIYRSVLLCNAAGADQLDYVRARQQVNRRSFMEVFSSEFPEEKKSYSEKISSFSEEFKDADAYTFIYRVMEREGFFKRAVTEEESAPLYSYFMRIVEEFSTHYGKFHGRAPFFREFMESLYDLLKGFGKDMDIPYISDREAVKIMTVQQSKGERFKVAYIADLNDEEFPRPYRENPLLSSRDRSNLSLKPVPGVPEQYEFEKRLFNIARTRSDTTVYCWYEHQDGGAPADISPFLRDMVPDEEKMIKSNRIVDIHDFLVAAAQLIPIKEIEELSLNSGDSELKEKVIFLKNILEYDPSSLRDRVTDGIPEIFSYTALKSFSSCPRSFFYRRILNIKEPPSINQFLGIAAHKALEKIYSDRIFSFEKAQKVLMQLWSDTGFYSSFESRNFYRILKKMVKEYYQCIKKEKDISAEKVYTEKSFKFHFRGKAFTGRFDRLESLKGGAERVVDYKTGSRVPAVRGQLNAVKRGDDFQIPIYRLARKPALFTIYRLREKAEKMRVDIDFSMESTRKSIRAGEELLLENISRIEEGIFKDGPEAKSKCRRCYFSGICDIEDE